MKLKKGTMKEWEELNLPKTSMTISAVSSQKSKKSLPKETKDTKPLSKKKKGSKMSPNEAFYRAEKLILEKYKEPQKKKPK